MVTNKQISKAFRKAIPYLNSGTGGYQTEYICFAISQSDRYSTATHFNPISPAAKQAIAIIESHLAGNNTMRGWLRTNGVSESELTWEKVQVHRHAWLKMLITEFENK